MLKKLFKLDFLWINRYFLPLAGGNLACAILSRLSNSFTSPLGSFFHGLMNSLTITLFFSLGINIFTRTAVGFKIKLFKDEAYLTHTLPVKASTLWASKVLSAILSILPVAFIILAALVINSLTAELWEGIKPFLEQFHVEFILLAIIALLELTFLYLCIFNGILIGRRASSRKTLRAALLIAGFYLGAQTLLAGLCALFATFSDAFSTLFSSEANALVFRQSPEDFHIVLLTVTIFYIVASTALYFLGQKTLAKGVDVE